MGHTGTTGSALKVLRESQGLTLRQLAEIAGTSASYISQVENGKREPTARWMAAVTTALANNIASAA